MGVVLASELRVHLQVKLHVSLVEGSDTGPLLSIDNSLDGHLLAWDTVNLQLPLVVLVEVEEHMQFGLPVRLNLDVKEGLGHPVVVVNGDLGLPHTSLHLPVENKGSLLGPVGQEHELLDELVVNLHVKEAIALLDDILTVGDLVGHGETSVGGVLPASLVGPGAVHVVGKESEKEGSPWGSVVVLDVVPGLAIEDVVLLNLHLVDHLSLVDLVKEEVAGVLHLGPLPTAGNHGVHPVEGALL